MDKLRERIFMTISSGVENVEITDQITDAIMDLIKPKELVWNDGEEGALASGAYELYNHWKSFVFFGDTLLSNHAIKANALLKPPHRTTLTACFTI